MLGSEANNKFHKRFHAFLVHIVYQYFTQFVQLKQY